MAGLHAQHCRHVVVESETEQACDEQPPEANTNIGVANGRLCKLQVKADPKKDPGVGGKGACVPPHPIIRRHRNGTAYVLGNNTLHGLLVWNYILSMVRTSSFIQCCSL